MKRAFIYILTIIVFSSFTQTNTLNQLSYNSFAKGEKLNYKVSFGFINVARANMNISPKSFRVNDRTCYKVEVKGKTTGAASWVAKVNDTWGSYIDNQSLTPQLSYRDISENNYKKKEISRFNHDTDSVEIKSINNATGDYNKAEYFRLPNNTRDLVSGYLYARAIDYSKMHIGDTVKIDAFFEDTVYDFKVIYQGKDKVKTSAGKFRTVKLMPIVPENSLFDGKNAITIWLSDDENKIPVKIKAKMFIGSTNIELVNYEGIQNKANHY